MYSVLVFGDSLSFGRGEIPNNGWVHRFKEKFETEQVHRGVYNLSIPGETSYSLNKRLDQEIKPRIWRRKENDRYVIILQVGGNDAKEIISKGNSATKIDLFINYMKKNIEIARKYCDEIIIIGLLHVDETKTQPFDTNVYFSNNIFEKYNSALKELCENNNVKFVNSFEEVKLQTDEYYDGVHPNSKGHNKLFSFFIEELKHLL